MLQEGCPPCYPPRVPIPLEAIPRKYRAIVGYWESLPSSDGTPLHTQLSDWQLFRRFQTRDRLRHKHNSFANLQHEIYQRRRKHGLDGNVPLAFEIDQQDEIANWVEYQNHILKRLEELQQTQANRRRNVDEAQEKLNNLCTATSVATEKSLTGYRYMLSVTEYRLGNHKVLVKWSEQQRLLMIKKRPTAAEDGRFEMDTLLKAPRRNSTRRCRVRQGTARVLGTARRTTEPAELPHPIATPRARAREQLKATPAEFRTRSGRISKMPRRWAPY